MKRILFLIVACVALFAQCTHPFEQDLLGSFPFAEMLSEEDYQLGSSANECVLKVSTNMSITTRIEYKEGAEKDWITLAASEEKGGIVRIDVSVTENFRREKRKAEIKLLADGLHEVALVKIGQSEYSFVGKENVHEGDLVLESQDEVKNCIYTKVNGNLIIGSYTSDITDISALSVIKSVTGGIKIVGCSKLAQMGELGNLAVSSVEFENVNPLLVQTWKGSVAEVTVRNITSGEVDLSSFKDAGKVVLKDNYCQFEGFDGLTSVKIAEMAGNEFSSADGLEKMTSLDSLDLSYNPLVNVNDLAKMTWVKKMDLSHTSLSAPQINYLREMLPSETEIVCEELSGRATMTLTNTKTEYFRAYFDAKYADLESVNTYGYVLKTTEKFNTDEIQPLKTTPNPQEIILKDLVADTGYYAWLYVVDENNAIHISDRVEFKTPEIVFDYEGDLVLETQDDVDNCVNVTVSGNLTIGKEGSDITDLSELTITAVGGGVTIKGCHALTDFGPAFEKYNLKYLELDDVSPSLVNRWNGTVSDLRIRNISTGTVDLSKFKDVTVLTLSGNSCGFNGCQYLSKLTDAVFADNQFTTIDDFKSMAALKNLDLRNNPLVNVNSLVDMKSLQKVDLSETKLSQTQINYLKNCLPATVNIITDNLKGNVTLNMGNTQVKYRSAKMMVEYTGLSSVNQCGYVLTKDGKFTREGWIETNRMSSSPYSYEIKNLDDNTQYHVWFYVKDNVGSIHISEPYTFTTKEAVENYVGDLVLTTQEDVDDCVHKSVQGNLIIGGTGTDINDLSSLKITSVTGNLTIKGCTELNDFGGLASLKVPHVILDNVTPDITSTWEGYTDALTIMNISSDYYYGCYLYYFEEISQLTLKDNKCSFYSLESLVNVKDAVLPRNNFKYLSEFETWTELETLDLNGNPLVNVNEIAGLTNLKSVDLSNTPLSQNQVRYVSESLPSATVKSDNITGTGTMSVSNTGAKYFSASFAASVSGISSDGGGYFISKSSTFPGDAGKVTVDRFSSGIPTTFEANTLDDGSVYYLWLYVKDDNESVHLSAPTKFTTLELKHYTLSLNPSWPLYANNSSEKSNFTAIGSRMLVYKEEVLGEKEAVLTKSDSEYSAEMTEGKTAMGLFAVQGTPNGNSYDGYTMEVTTKDMNSPKWTLSLTSENGSGSDIAIASLKNDFQDDASFDVQFVRPVAKVNITADFTGSINNLDNVKDITISLHSHYTKCHFADISSVEYNSAKDLKFYAAISSIPDDKKIMLAKDRFVLPHNSNTPSASVTITFKNGTTKTARLTYSTKIEANKVYDLTFVTAITDVQGSFTVDVVEVVHDEIEF